MSEGSVATSSSYRPRSPTEGALYEVLLEHLGLESVPPSPAPARPPPQLELVFQGEILQLIERLGGGDVCGALVVVS